MLMRHQRNVSNMLSHFTLKGVLVKIYVKLTGKMTHQSQ